MQLSVVHRLPLKWRISEDCFRRLVESQAQASGDDFIGLQLLSHTETPAWDIMYQLQQALSEIQLESIVAEWQGQPCLFVHRYDESATNCRLKDLGIVIAESVPEPRQRLGSGEPE
ncbi:hypothetical protein ACGVWS_09125 [Enterobacteriaceae bacterium LUAb1]